MACSKTLIHLFLLVAIRVFMNASMIFVAPYSPFLAKKLHTDMNAMALTLSATYAFGVPVPIMMMSIHHALSKHGRSISHKAWIIAFGFACAVFGALSCVSSNVVWFIISRGLVGGCYVGFIGAVIGYVSLIDINSLGTLIAFGELGGSLAWFLPSTSGWMMAYSWKIPFLVWATLIFLCTVVALLVIPDLREERIVEGERQPLLRTGETPTSSIGPLKRLWTVVRRDQSLMSLLLISVPGGYLLFSPSTVFGLWVFDIFHTKVSNAAIASLVIGVGIFSGDLICLAALDVYRSPNILRANSLIALTIVTITTIVVSVNDLPLNDSTYAYSLFVLGSLKLMGNVSFTTGLHVTVEQLTISRMNLPEFNEGEDLKSEFGALAWSMGALGGGIQGLTIPLMWYSVGWRPILMLYIAVYSCVFVAASLIRFTLPDIILPQTNGKPLAHSSVMIDETTAE